MPQAPAQYGQDRVRCPQCGSNNFIGQQICWQCKRSLPPPEAFQSSPAPQPARQQPPYFAPAQTAQPPPFQQPQQAQQQQPGWQPIYAHPDFMPPRRQSRAVWIAIPIVVLVLGGLMFTVLGARSKSQGIGVSSEQATLNALKDQMLRQAGQERSGQSVEQDVDPNESAAQREVRRLKKEIESRGVPMGGGTEDIRLQGGGSITKDQYEQTLRSMSGGHSTNR